MCTDPREPSPAPARIRLYTRGGDEGRTSLPGGERVGKDDPRIEACGTLDELNCHVGLLRAMLRAAPARPGATDAELDDVQRDLFRAGRCLYGDPPPAEAAALEAGTRRLERSLDTMAARDGAAWQGFVLPGGSLPAAQAHVCRTLCRRTERRACAVRPAPAAPVRAYLNRLSDYFYALALTLNAFYGREERKT